MTREGHVSLKQNGTESKYSISLFDAFPHPMHFPEAQLCLQWEVPVCAGGNCVACVMGGDHWVGWQKNLFDGFDLLRSSLVNCTRHIFLGPVQFPHGHYQQPKDASRPLKQCDKEQ